MSRHTERATGCDSRGIHEVFDSGSISKAASDVLGGWRLVGCSEVDRPFWVSGGHYSVDQEVRFTPKSRHAHRRHQCLLSARSGRRSPRACTHKIIAGNVCFTRDSGRAASSHKSLLSATSRHWEKHPSLSWSELKLGVGKHRSRHNRRLTNRCPRAGIQSPRQATTLTIDPGVQVCGY
jgi:hypothetical protein